MRREDIDSGRLWSKVDKRGPDECWNWKACVDRWGYGQFRVGGKTRKAHRVAYALEHGACDAPLLRHLCGNAACCNPAHLAPGTQIENMHDRREHGTAGGGALTEENVLDIIELLQAGFAYEIIAEAYECSRRHVSNIATGMAWDWVCPWVDRESLRRHKPPAKPRAKVTREIRDRVYKLRGQGLLQRAIADHVGVSQKTVCNILRARP